MTIAIDLDGTWTLDAAAWRMFCATFQELGHTVLIATGRSAWSDDMLRWNLPAVPILFCGGRPKAQVCREAGFRVDVWIDNEPQTVHGTLAPCEDL